MAPEIRVALVDLPPLLREIVSGALMGASDVDIVDYYADRKALMQALPIAHVDAVVIAPSQSERDEIARELLSADGKTASRGVLSGVIPTEEYLAILKQELGLYSPSLCSARLFTTECSAAVFSRSFTRRSPRSPSCTARRWNITCW